MSFQWSAPTETLPTLCQSPLLPVSSSSFSMCDPRSWLKNCLGSREDAVREVMRLGTLYASYVVQADTELAQLAPEAKVLCGAYKANPKNEAAKKAACVVALRIRKLRDRRHKYQHLSERCRDEGEKLQEIHEMNATIGAFSHLNRILKRADITSLVRGAENAVADAEGVSEHLNEIGKLIGTPAGTSVELSDEELMAELELISGEASAAVVVEAPVPVAVATARPTPVSATEYMRTLLANQ